MTKTDIAARALHLVREYGRLTEAIADCKRAIGAELDKCPGVSGHRRETDPHLFDSMTQRAMDDKTHLAAWYTVADRDEDGSPYYEGEPSEDACPHCWQAHRIVKQRKAFRRSLAAIKGAMRRLAKSDRAKAA